MRVNGKQYKALWTARGKNALFVIDQTKLPYSFEIIELSSYSEVVAAIKDMRIRGAPLIGIAGAYSVWLASAEAIRQEYPDLFLHNAYSQIVTARPTAINLKYAATKIYQSLLEVTNTGQWPETALQLAGDFYKDEIKNFLKIGSYGLGIIKKIALKKKNKTVNILTHCNAGWLACGDFGTATAPIYKANSSGINIHVWVDETRPRYQGAKLTAWELHHENVPFTVITDNAGGYLMQQGKVDLVIVGADRIASNGDTANKIGTYIKALAASANNIPFYVAAPSSTFDFHLNSGIKFIPIEVRDNAELNKVSGLLNNKIINNVEIFPGNYPVSNYSFDITPFNLISGFITEKGIIDANENRLRKILQNGKK